MNLEKSWARKTVLLTMTNLRFKTFHFLLGVFKPGKNPGSKLTLKKYITAYKMGLCRKVVLLKGSCDEVQIKTLGGGPHFYRNIYL